MIVVRLPEQRPPMPDPRGARALARIVAKAHQRRQTQEAQAA